MFAKFNPLAMVGNAAAQLVENLSDKILPEPIGDLASGFINLKTGNFEGLLGDALDLGDNVVRGLGGFLDEFLKSEPDAPKQTGTAGVGSLAGALDNVIAKAEEALVAMKIDGRDSVETSSTTHAISSSGSSTATSGSGSSGVSRDGKAFIELAKKDPDAFFNAVLNGDVPDSVKNDPALMQALQANVQNIARMMQLMTNLLKAVHEAQMGVIRNVRV